MRFILTKLFPCLIALALVISLVTGCTDKGTESYPATNQDVELRARVSSAAGVEQVDLFILTITARDMDAVVDTLLLEDGEIVGEIEVPVGTQRAFLLQAFDILPNGGDPVLIYQGVTIIDVLPGQEVRLVIDLEPVVPMVRLSPRFAEIESGSVFEVDIEVANVPNLAGLNILLDFAQPNYAISPIRVVRHESQSSDVIVVGADEYDGLRYRVVAVDSSLHSMTNSDGDGVLATVTFTTEGYVDDLNRAVNITIMDMAMVDINQDSIPVLNMERDFTELVLTSRTDRIIQFPDTALLSAVLSHLEANEPPVYFSDVQYLTYFSAGEAGIVDLTGLGELVNMNTLQLDYNDIVDLGPLATLLNLISLSVEGNDIVNLGPAGELVGLTTLMASYNEITNIAPLSGLSELRTVDVGNNQIVNLAPLEPMWQLTSLRLNNNLITDITPLAGLLNPYTLELQYNSITDISPLLDIPGWGEGDRIDLSGNPLDDAEQQSFMDSLRQTGATVIYGT